MKYRVWDKFQKIFIQNIVVDNSGELIILIGNIWQYLNDKEKNNFIISKYSNYETKYGYLCEGDIVSDISSKNPLIVVYDEKKWLLYNNLKGTYIEISDNIKDKIKIIGNVYETPELLEK